MFDVTSLLTSDEEISTFCPVRIYLANRRFDGLLDTLDTRGGNFYVLTDHALPKTEVIERGVLLKENRVELAIGTSTSELRIPCRIRGMRFDEEGLFAYVGLEFLTKEDNVKRRLDDFIASIW